MCQDDEQQHKISLTIKNEESGTSFDMTLEFYCEDIIGMLIDTIKTKFKYILSM
jgi:hypothetical protein